MAYLVAAFRPPDWADTSTGVYAEAISGFEYDRALESVKRGIQEDWKRMPTVAALREALWRGAPAQVRAGRDTEIHSTASVEAAMSRRRDLGAPEGECGNCREEHGHPRNCLNPRICIHGWTLARMHAERKKAPEPHAQPSVPLEANEAVLGASSP